MLVQINDIVASMMVLPNRQVFPLVSDLQIGHLRWSNPQVSGSERVVDRHASLPLGRGARDGDQSSRSGESRSDTSGQRQKRSVCSRERYVSDSLIAMPRTCGCNDA